MLETQNMVSAWKTVRPWQSWKETIHFYSRPLFFYWVVSRDNRFNGLNMSMDSDLSEISCTTRVQTWQQILRQ